MVILGDVRAKILVVDDEPEAVELVEFNLKQAGFDVVTAADGAEALKRRTPCCRAWSSWT
jgi:CheY-like chemotaxis protein